MRHRDEWYINDEFIDEPGNFREKIHDYEAWYEEYGNYVINKPIKNDDNPNSFFENEIIKKTVGFKPFDVKRIMSPKIIKTEE